MGEVRGKLWVCLLMLGRRKRILCWRRFLCMILLRRRGWGGSVFTFAATSESVAMCSMFEDIMESELAQLADSVNC